MKPIISVVIPIYNTASHLRKCLDSLICQTLENIEIICVDDVSPDKSSDIVNEYVKNDNRVRLIQHKVNKGQGGARNTGIASARAEFIASVDSDDSIKPQMLETLLNASNNGYFDIVCCGYSRVNDFGKVLQDSKFKARELEGQDKKEANIFTMMNPSFCNKLWKKSLFLDNNIMFPHKLYYQDMATIPLLVAKAEKIKFINESLYNYYVREGSVTTTFSDKHILDYFKVYSLLYVQLERLGIQAQYKDQLFDYVSEGMKFHSSNVVSSDMNNSDKLQYLRHLLMLKVSFIESHTNLIEKSQAELLILLKEATSVQDIIPAKSVEKNAVSCDEDTNDQTVISYLKGTMNAPPVKGDSVYNNEKHALSNNFLKFQQYGSQLFGVLFFFFIRPRQRVKLKTNPKAFFADSKNKFTRFVGRILKII